MSLNVEAVRNLIWVAAIFVGMLVVSMFSGFHSVPVPFEASWQFTPLGLLTHRNADLLGLPCVSGFIGSFGTTYDYLGVFLLTCLFESPFYLLAFRSRGLTEGLRALVLCNALTHPLVYFAFPAVFSSFLPMSLCAEAFAPAVEMVAAVVLVGRRGGEVDRRGVALLVLLANLFSWQMGAFV